MFGWDISFALVQTKSLNELLPLACLKKLKYLNRMAHFSPPYNMTAQKMYETFQSL